MSPRTRQAVVAVFFLLLVLGVWRMWRASDAPAPEVATEEPPVTLETTFPETPAPVASPSATRPADTSVPPNLDRLERARRIRSEIKISLSGLYAAERAFYSESGRYSTDFDVVGWMPTSQKLSAKVGFLYPYQPSPDEYRDRMDRFDTDQAVEASKTFEDPDSHMSYQDSAIRVSMRSLGSYCEMNCTADANGFEAIAAANLDDDDELDVWRINDRKELVHLFDDLEGRPPLDARGEKFPSLPEDPVGDDEDIPLPPSPDQMPLAPPEMGPPGEPQPDEFMPPEELEPTPESGEPSA
ncbi:MAG: hypothetical protein KF767_16915 [Bdellovibrionaceae bacterium]|nr:hypothetical protein [Pseudobdellovibrionaceae bacterium]